MSDVGERSRVNENGSSFEGLHNVGFDRVLHQDGEGTGTSDIVTSDRVSLCRFSDDHATETNDARDPEISDKSSGSLDERSLPFTHVGKVVREGEDCHCLGGDSNIERGIHRLALFSGSKSSRDVTKVSIVCVDNSVPY